MAKNLISGPISACLAEIWAPELLDIVVNYHYVQFQGKRMTQTQENRKKSRTRWAQIRAANFSF